MSWHQCRVLAGVSSRLHGFESNTAISRGPHGVWTRFVSSRRDTGCACQARYASNWSPIPSLGPNLPDDDPPDGDAGGKKGQKGTREERRSWKDTAFKASETALTTFASIFVLGLAGYGYHIYYKSLVLRKMDIAFRPGDPVLELAASSPVPPATLAGQDEEREWIRRSEQDLIDALVAGREKGHYYLIIGEKGTGKSSMLLAGMKKIDGEGVAMLEAHADLEIFRVRLGKALNYEFHEDYIGSLFSIKGPRDTTALLDIERAFNKLEKIAIRRRRAVGRPLVLIINSTHLLRNDDDGRDLLELVQQRAEQWAASNLVTVILNSDDYWVYERLKQLATRLEVLPVLDLPRPQALTALAAYRRKSFPQAEPDPAALESVYRAVGGRLSFLSRVAKAPDMALECDRICATEQTWFLNQCWILGTDMDDDVMDQQKYASAAMVLAKALVGLEQSPEWRERRRQAADPLGHFLPEIPLHQAREIMTRADFIQQYDHVNLFTIDSKAMVRADSVPMMNAFRQICARPGFDLHLERTLERIDAIESLGRTREIVAKDLIDKRYKIRLAGGKELVVDIEEKPDDP